MLRSALLLVALIVAVAPVTCDALNSEYRTYRHTAADLVTELPGYGPLGDLKIYSGLLKPDAHRNIQYALVEHESDPDLGKKPLILFLNGGPGCSGIGNAFLAEVGPFFTTWLEGGQPGLRPNPHSWSKLASLLFLDVPVGVGWSFSTREKDYVTDDAKATRDNYNIVQTFLKAYPVFKTSPLYIFGESYAGHFASQLVELILKKNDKLALGKHAHNDDDDDDDANHDDDDDMVINMEGLGLVNAWIDPWHDEIGIVDYMYHHGLISTSKSNLLRDLCDFGPDGDDDRSEERLNAISTCDNALYDSVLEQGWLDIYYISEDQCVSPYMKAPHLAMRNASAQSSAQQLMTTRRLLSDRRIASRMADPAGMNTQQLAVLGPGAARAAAHVAASRPTGMGRVAGLAGKGLAAVPDYDPCIALQKFDYLNLREVQDALHGNMSGDIPGRWCPCCNSLKYHTDDILVSVLPIFRKLVRRPNNKSVRILAMSGDQDSVVPFTSTRNWVESLALPLLKDWAPWYSTSDQVAGYAAIYEGLTFATVRSAGHMVPYAQPERTFWLLSQFLKKKDP